MTSKSMQSMHRRKRPLAISVALLFLLVQAPPCRGGRRAGGRGKSKPSKRKANKLAAAAGIIPAFDCAVPEWAPAKPEELAEVDLGVDYCDWEVRSTVPSDDEFREKYWQQAPVIVRNFTASWPATERWHKQQLWERYGEREVSTFDSDTYLVSHSKWVPNRLADFLKKEVCEEKVLSKEQQLHQEYVFDKDGIFGSVPELLEDYNHPPFITQFFDEAVHEKFSRYFLVGASMSGINYHSHTDAYNGLVHGRKRWFVYDHAKMRDPPFRSHGTLRWMREVLPTLPPDQRPLQCMQQAGDLIYVPQGYWHGTINLGETIGVSGQFVRNTNKWARESEQAVNEERWDDAAELYLKMLQFPGPHDMDARYNRGLALFKAGRRDEAILQVEDFRQHWGTISPSEYNVKPEKQEANDKKANMLLQALGVPLPAPGNALPGVGRGVVPSHTADNPLSGFDYTKPKGEL